MPMPRQSAGGCRGFAELGALTRRDFLRAGALSAGAVGLSLADLAQLQAAPGRRTDVNCILLFLVGGPSHLDTWDLKPAAPSEVRGPFRPIATNVPGVHVCEHFPRMARMADRYAIVRSVHHREAPIHETGHQLMQTGRLFRGGVEHPVHLWKLRGLVAEKREIRTQLVGRRAELEQFGGILAACLATGKGRHGESLTLLAISGYI